jgi:hypothetical protein
VGENEPEPQSTRPVPGVTDIEPDLELARRPGPVPGSTNDLAQQRSTPGTFTGAWKIMVNGEEVHRFSGIGNNQSDANRVAVNWLRNHGYEHGSDAEVLPIMS